jgi:serine/threonine-protein kinase
MKKTGFWTSDWFFGLVIAIVFFGLSIATGLFSGLETKAYDWGVQATSKQPSDKIAVIAIDEQSLANLGRWPWPRDIHAAMIDKLAAAKAKVIGNTIFYFEPQQDPGLQYVTKLLQVYAKHTPSVTEGATALPAATNPAVAEFGPILYEAEQALNTDRRVAESIRKAGNVILASQFVTTLYPPVGKPDKQLPEFVGKNVVTGFTNSGGEFV